MKAVFDVVAEPKGKTYIDLLNFAASRCESFSLVWRAQFNFVPSAYEIKPTQPIAMGLFAIYAVIALIIAAVMTSFGGSH